MSSKLDTAYAVLAGGCFWCLEALFERIPGVVSVVSGYSGGEIEDPTYEQVCTGDTGHAEAVRIEFDPNRISYNEILSYFWKSHDPTTRNRQGADVGTQYRSVIFYSDEEQREQAGVSMDEIERSGMLRRKIVTELVPLEKFYPAEEYHQHYFERNPGAGYCRIVIRPKVDKIEVELRQKS